MFKKYKLTKKCPRKITRLKIIKVVHCDEFTIQLKNYNRKERILKTKKIRGKITELK